MLTESTEQFIISWRDRLQSLGIAADDLPDDAVMREATLRGMLDVLGRCTLPVASWDKRFVRQVGGYPKLITPKQEEQIGRLWQRYRRQTRHISRPDHLPPVPPV